MLTLPCLVKPDTRGELIAICPFYFFPQFRGDAEKLVI
jgi:hypothetical protein